MDTIEKLYRKMNAADEAEKTTPVQLVRMSIFHCQVCAPADMTAEQVACETNRISVCGTSNGWTISAEHPPVVCVEDSTRRHWILAA